MPSKLVVIVGGHGLTSICCVPILRASNYEVRSTYRPGKASHAKELKSLGAEPVALDLAKASTQDFASLCKNAHAVIWSAGARNTTSVLLLLLSLVFICRSDYEMCEDIDHQAFVKVLDAIELNGKPYARFLTVSAIDNRDINDVRLLFSRQTC